MEERLGDRQMSKSNTPRIKKEDRLDILYQDADIVVINKPAHLAAIPGRGETDSVIERLSRNTGLPWKGKDDPRLRVVHRIDKDTTGVLLFAKHIGAQRHLSHQFQNNQIRKEYLALLIGKTVDDDGVIDAPLAPHPTARDRMSVSKQGRPAITEWRVEKRMRRFTLVRVFPKTGKTHQIRVHFCHYGYPLAIDPLYNSAQSNAPAGSPIGIYLSQHKRHYRPTHGEEERPLIARLTLHAHKLGFVHPNGQEMVIEAPVPKDLRATINQLSKA
ncbi:MAG: RluA family pseudouridine synthase [Burkholderiales bacterium]|nr:RluA family pseudouridine synthase [Phycisphaerae bacterium]